jgi:Xaa-Pro dipeptidase
MSREDRQQRLRKTMDRLDLGVVLLGLPANFAHYTGGADNRVDHSDPLGVAALLVTPETEYVVTDNIEAPRMREEETPNFEVVEHPWYEEAVPLCWELSGGAPVGADFPLGGTRDVSEEIAPLRYVLDAEAIETYRRAGSETTGAMEEAATSLSPGMTEYEAAANLVAACRKRGLTTSVTLVAADERIASYRHPIPRGKSMWRRAMLVVCAELGGLYVSLTRMVHFEEPDGYFERRQGACEEILRRMGEETTRPGRTLADAFEDCKRFYAEVGFPDEWRLHHQGGDGRLRCARDYRGSGDFAGDTGWAGFRLEPLHNRGEGRGDLCPHR